MTQDQIYQNIAQRTGGDIYLGVVGPVRTGKSTFFKRFMEQLVLPNIENVYERERATDELPQSSAGRTIMTTEPKFIPEQAVSIKNNAIIIVQNMINFLFIFFPPSIIILIQQPLQKHLSLFLKRLLFSYFGAEKPVIPILFYFHGISSNLISLPDSFS